MAGADVAGLGVGGEEEGGGHHRRGDVVGLIQVRVVRVRKLNMSRMNRILCQLHIIRKNARISGWALGQE